MAAMSMQSAVTLQALTNAHANLNLMEMAKNARVSMLKYMFKS